jgi:hypothetical protein
LGETEVVHFTGSSDWQASAHCSFENH